MKKLIASTAAVAIFATLAGVPAYAKSDEHKGGPKIEFAELDTDGNGEISAEELAAYQQARFDDIDADGDGSVTAEEMSAHMIASFAEAQEERVAKRVEKLLERADANEDGTLSADELSPPEGRSIFDRLDKDENGTVSAEEFEAMKDRGERGERGGKGRGGDSK